MGSKSQRKLDRKRKKLKEKQKKRSEVLARRREIQIGPEVVGRNARHRARLSQQVPQAWPGEIVEDAALFDEGALAGLAPDLAEQARTVRAALQDALELRGDDALKRLSAVSRTSPLSEWRLFVRGLVSWLANETDAANEAWKRLNPARRAGRIAAVMTASLRSDLEQLSPALNSPPGRQQAEDQPGAASPPAESELDGQQLYHAKLLRRVCFERAALRVAEAGLNVAEESKELLLGPKKMQWLRAFLREYEETEPELAAALAQAALGRAFAQNFGDLFEEALRSFPGPKHDRRNRLLTFFYYSRFGNDPTASRKAASALEGYLKSDLPQNQAISTPLRAAIASQLHLNQAQMLIQPAGVGGMLGQTVFGRLPEPKEDARGIRNHLLAAVAANPTNSLAYAAHVDWLKAKLDDERLAKQEQTRLEAELADVMSSWSQGLPQAVEPRLWLVDYFLENERLEEARPHVEFLSTARQDDPRVRATPWKWQLLLAMQHSRRKATLAKVPPRLDEAEALWPAWLPKQWMPYLRAAWALRNRHVESFEEQRRQICQQSGLARDSLPDACQMLGAAQQMGVASAELKPLRAVLDRALKEIDAAPLATLLETGSFFWDLHRAQLLYPAYRMHGRTIGKALCARLAKAAGPTLEGVPLDGIQDARVAKAVLWASEYRFWPSNYETKFPPLLSANNAQQNPLFAAARLNATLKETYPWNAEKCRELGPLLRAAAQTERDAYYRHWFVELADQLDDALARKSSPLAGSPFGDLLDGIFGGEEYDDDDDDWDDEDSPCDCPKCRAKRAKQQAFASNTKPF
jgi:hypothetical protein